MRTRALVALSLIACATAATGEARANGAFPAAGQIVVHPTDPSRLWVRTDFGIGVSVDGGASWRMLCREGVGYANAMRPSLGVTPTGKLVAAVPVGLLVGAPDGCSFAPAPELDGYDVGDVSQHPSGATFVSASRGLGDSHVFVSNDDAVTWQATPAELPVKFLALTLDAAPSDPSHIYLSGTTGDPAAPVGSFVRSFDGGATFEEILVPGSTLATAPFIAAVDPMDPLRVYVRLHGAPGRLLVTPDGGDTWEEIFVGVGFLRAFALSPDGAVAYVGGEADGILRADVPDYDFTQLSDLPARCLRVLPGVTYACGNEVQQGYSITRSLDGGASFTPLFRQKCLEGTVCDVATPVGGTCDAVWPTLREQIGVEACGAGGGSGVSVAASTGPGQGPGPSSGSGAEKGPSTAAAGAGTGATSGTGGAGGETPGGGCGACSVGADRNTSAALAALGVLMGMASMRRSRRRRSTHRDRTDLASAGSRTRSEPGSAPTCAP